MGGTQQSRQQDVRESRGALVRESSFAIPTSSSWLFDTCYYDGRSGDVDFPFKAKSSGSYTYDIEGLSVADDVNETVLAGEAGDMNACFRSTVFTHFSRENGAEEGSDMVFFDDYVPADEHSAQDRVTVDRLDDSVNEKGACMESPAEKSWIGKIVKDSRSNMSGTVIAEDLANPIMTYKVFFGDDCEPTHNWCAKYDVTLEKAEKAFLPDVPRERPVDGCLPKVVRKQTRFPNSKSEQDDTAEDTDGQPPSPLEENTLNPTVLPSDMLARENGSKFMPPLRSGVYRFSAVETNQEHTVPREVLDKEALGGIPSPSVFAQPELSQPLSERLPADNTEGISEDFVRATPRSDVAPDGEISSSYDDQGDGAQSSECVQARASVTEPFADTVADEHTMPPMDNVVGPAMADEFFVTPREQVMTPSPHEQVMTPCADDGGMSRQTSNESDGMPPLLLTSKDNMDRQVSNESDGMPPLLSTSKENMDRQVSNASSEADMPLLVSFDSPASTQTTCGLPSDAAQAEVGQSDLDDDEDDEGWTRQQSPFADPNQEAHSDEPLPFVFGQSRENSVDERGSDVSDDDRPPLASSSNKAPVCDSDTDDCRSIESETDFEASATEDDVEEEEMHSLAFVCKMALAETQLPKIEEEPEESDSEFDDSRNGA